MHEFVLSCLHTMVPVMPFPAYGRPRGLAKKRKPGALGFGFNKNFPLACGHSSRALRFQNSSKPFGLIPSAPGRLRTVRSEAAWSGFDEPQRRVT
jgi:hypothetical protein